MLGAVNAGGIMRLAQTARRGITLIELLIGLVVVAVLAAIAVPSMHEFIMRKRVQGVADELVANLRLMRTASMVNAKGWTMVHFSSTDTTTCYVVFGWGHGSVCDCLAMQLCRAKVPPVPVYQLVKLDPNRQVRVTPVHGTAPAMMIDSNTGLPERYNPLTGLYDASLTISIDVYAPAGGRVRVSTNAIGQPSVCSVAGHSGIYPDCAP